MNDRCQNLFVIGTTLGIIVGITLCLAPPVDGSQQEHWLQYHSSPQAMETIGDTQRMNLDFMPESPPGVRLPLLKDQKPQFMKWLTPMVQGGWLWLALDSSSPNEKYDSLYIDSNGDGHLGDETVVRNSGTEEFVRFFGPVKVTFQTEDGPVVYHLNFWHYSGNDCLYAHSACWYEGDITVAGVRKRCRLIDYNSNGTFDDVFKYPHLGDRIRIAESDGKESHFVGRYIEIDGALYEPQIARDGAHIKLARAEDVRFGKLRVPESIEEFSIGGQNGSFLCRPENGLLSLPVGRYGIEQWAIERKDKTGMLWEVRGTDLFSKSMFDISGNKETEISLGEPIVYRLEVTGKAPGLYFNQIVRGKYGDHIKISRGGAKPEPPELRIKSNDGSYDQSFNFKYG